MKGIYSCLLIGFCAFAITAYGQSNQSKLINKWTIAGTLKNGNVIPDSKKKEYEFLKGNKLNIYSNGATDGSGSYTLSGDQNSVLLKIDGESLSLKIVKLSTTELRYVLSLKKLSKDTIVCFASNSPIAKSTQKKAIYYEEAKKKALQMATNYKRRYDVISNLVHTVEWKAGAESDIYKKLLSAYKKGYTELAVNDFSEKAVQEYESQQADLTSAIADLKKAAPNYPDLQNYDNYKSMIGMVDALQEKIDVSQKEFHAAYSKCLGK